MSTDTNPPDDEKQRDKEMLVKFIIMKIKNHHRLGRTPTFIPEEAEPLWLEILMQAPEDMLQSLGPTTEIEAYVQGELVRRSK